MAYKARKEKEAERTNQTAKFWEIEDPEVMTTEKNVMRYYPKAERLVIHLPDYTHAQTGAQMPGKGCGINLEALAYAPEVLDRIIEILSSYKGRYKD